MPNNHRSSYLENQKWKRKCSSTRSSNDQPQTESNHRNKKKSRNLADPTDAEYRELKGSKNPSRKPKNNRTLSPPARSIPLGKGASFFLNNQLQRRKTEHAEKTERSKPTLSPFGNAFAPCAPAGLRARPFISDAGRKLFGISSTTPCTATTEQSKDHTS